MFSFGKNKTGRTKQIKGLSKINGAKSLAKDQSKWVINFRTRLGQVNLFVDLPPSFPQQAPKLYIKGLRHFLCDNYGNVIITKLLLSGKWDPNRDTIENLVNKVVVQMNTSPPQPLQQQQQYQQPRNNPPSYGSHFNNNNINNNYNNNNKFNSQQSSDDLMEISVPNNIFELPYIKDLTESEMRNMLNSDSQLKDIAFQGAENYREMKNTTASSILSEAQSNVSKKDSIDKLAKECNEIREEVETLTEIFKKLNERHQNVIKKFAPEKIVKEFDNELEKIDTETEELKEKFEEGDMSHVKFTKDYLKLREKYHDLSIRKERFIAQFG